MSDVNTVADFSQKTFALSFGEVFFAPGRINISLTGDDTDDNSGLALPVEISARTSVAIGPNHSRDPLISDFSSLINVSAHDEGAPSKTSNFLHIAAGSRAHHSAILRPVAP